MAAAAKQSQKMKKKSKASARTAAMQPEGSSASSSGTATPSVLSSRPETSSTSAPAEGESASQNSGQKAKPRPKKSVALSENVDEALRRKIELLPVGERQQEISRLNALSPEELATECNRAKADDFARPGPVLAGPHDDPFIPDRLLNQQVPAATNVSQGSPFLSDLDRIPIFPNDPAAPVPFGTDLEFNLLEINPSFHVPSLTITDVSMFDLEAPIPTLTGDVPLAFDPTAVVAAVPIAVTTIPTSVAATPAPTAATPASVAAPVSSPDAGLAGTLTPVTAPAVAGTPPASTPPIGHDDGFCFTLPFTSGSGVDLEGVPDWLVQQYKTFAAEAVPAEVAGVWSDLLHDWIAFEREMGFHCPVSLWKSYASVRSLIPRSASVSRLPIALTTSRYGSRMRVSVALLSRSLRRTLSSGASGGDASTPAGVRTPAATWRPTVLETGAACSSPAPTGS